MTGAPWSRAGREMGAQRNIRLDQAWLESCHFKDSLPSDKPTMDKVCMYTHNLCKLTNIPLISFYMCDVLLIGLLQKFDNNQPETVLDPARAGWK